MTVSTNQSTSPRKRLASPTTGAPKARVTKVVVTAGAPSADKVAFKVGDKVAAFVRRVADATPMQLVEAERAGVKALFIKKLSTHIGLPATRVYEIVGVPKATVEKRTIQDGEITGAGGQAALAMAKLLAKAQSIVDNSTSAEAANFDTAKWLGQWLERPQPVLGGRKPAELVGTPTGADIVLRLLGSMESGAYQ